MDIYKSNSWKFQPDPMPTEWNLDKMAELTSKIGPEVQCVIAAFDNLISYVKLMKAVSVLSRPNSVFIATNTDEQFPFSSSCILPGGWPTTFTPVFNSNQINILRSII